MGNFFADTFDKVWSQCIQGHYVSMIGLQNAGKTTIIYKLRIGERIIGHSSTLRIEYGHYKNLSIKTWDVGGDS